MDNQLIKREHAITIKQHNAITEARYDMSATEQNIVYMLLAQLEDDDPIDKLYTIHVKELEQLTTSQLNYNHLKEATKKLINRVYNIRDGDKLIQFGLLTVARYKKGTGTIVLRLSESIRPYFFQLKNRYTLFELHMSLKLKSKYSKRMYQMLCQWKDTRVMKISVQEFKERFELIDLKTGKEEYTKFGMFASKVLEVAKQELAEYTNMNFEYIAKKKGRKITDLEFKIYYKPAIKKPVVPASNLSISNEVLQKESDQLQKTTFKKEKGFKKFPPEQCRLYKRLKELALSKELAALVVDNIPTKELESEIDDFYNSVTQRKNKTTITPHFEDLLSRYAGIIVRRNYKVNSISKKEPTDADPKEASLVKEIDPSYAFCFDTLKNFGVSYADIQALLIQAPLDEIKIFLEKVSKELEENDEPNKANYVIKNFYTAFGSPHIKSSEQEKVQTLGDKLRNRIYTKQEDLNNEGK